MNEIHQQYSTVEAVQRAAKWVWSESDDDEHMHGYKAAAGGGFGIEAGMKKSERQIK